MRNTDTAGNADWEYREYWEYYFCIFCVDAKRLQNAAAHGTHTAMFLSVPVRYSLPAGSALRQALSQPQRGIIAFLFCRADFA
ncbi:MAG: hypothetical protein J6S73_03815 [Lentisphaeria bacterium]|nr:hypothetical protein [Lentisphaeria bacterium]